MEKQIRHAENCFRSPKRWARHDCIIITDNKKAEVASTLTAHALRHESDLRILLATLDCRLLFTFKDEIIEKAFYNINLKFPHLEKQPEMSMNDYILEFENLDH